MSEEKINYNYFRQFLLNEQSRLKCLLGAVTTNLKLPDKKAKKSAKDKQDTSEMESTAKLKAHLQMINDALKRLDNFEYGVCISCKKQISKSRLGSMPENPYCLICDMSHHLR